jgi:hypothetical protein
LLANVSQSSGDGGRDGQPGDRRSNAVWHATGRRIRDLPIRIEDLL